jgi:hypothetical protein
MSKWVTRKPWRASGIEKRPVPASRILRTPASRDEISRSRCAFWMKSSRNSHSRRASSPGLDGWLQKRSAISSGSAMSDELSSVWFVRSDLQLTQLLASAKPHRPAAAPLIVGDVSYNLETDAGEQGSVLRRCETRVIERLVLERVCAR